MKKDLNSKSITGLAFMGRYAGLELEINDGQIVDYRFRDRTYETPAAGTAGESV